MKKLKDKISKMTAIDICEYQPENFMAFTEF